MAKYNDIDMTKWKEYHEIKTDSLWIYDKRDNSGIHNGSYHGNFIPQIPHQLFQRYTKTGDWILDPFMGSGTSLIEAQRLKRNIIGIELQREVAKNTYFNLKKEPTTTQTIIKNGDSKTIDIKSILTDIGIKQYQFVIMHPPYWDIIKFSNDKEDLSNTNSLDNFLSAFSLVIDNTTQYLEKKRYCALVIGDKYANSQIVPLGFHCMSLFLSRNFILKAIIVKNFEDTKAKKNQQHIWRYRSLASDFYLFKHEYIFIFKKLK